MRAGVNVFPGKTTGGDISGAAGVAGAAGGTAGTAAGASGTRCGRVERQYEAPQGGQ